jgi:hypothetical protein
MASQERYILAFFIRAREFKDVCGVVEAAGCEGVVEDFGWW